MAVKISPLSGDSILGRGSTLRAGCGLLSVSATLAWQQQKQEPGAAETEWLALPSIP